MNSSTATSPLERYAYNLTRLARQGMLSPLIGYDRLVTRIFDVLLRKAKSTRSYNPLLLDEDEMDRTRVILEVVRRMALGNAPEPLPSLQVIAPNFDMLCVPSSIMTLQEVPRNDPEAEVEKLTHLLSWPPSDSWNTLDILLSRFEAFFSVVQHTADPTLLVLNDFHRLISQEPWPSAVNLFSLLVPALARREIQFLGTSTLTHYRSSIERLAPIQIRVQGLVRRSDEALQQK